MSILDAEGREVENYVGDNLIVDGGYIATAQVLGGTPEAVISEVGVGTNGASPEGSDTGLTKVEFVKIEGVDYPSPSTVSFNFRIGYNDAKDMEIREFGLFTKDRRLFSRRVREGAIKKTDDMTIVGRWDIIVA